MDNLGMKQDRRVRITNKEKTNTRVTSVFVWYVLWHESINQILILDDAILMDVLYSTLSSACNAIV